MHVHFRSRTGNIERLSDNIVDDTRNFTTQNEMIKADILKLKTENIDKKMIWQKLICHRLKRKTFL